jgi:hypothetical protein
MDAECEAWARRCLDGLGLEVPIRLSLVKRRAWSTVWRIETAGPTYYLKAASPGFDVEPALLLQLARWTCALVVEPVAAEPHRGWLITRDAGLPLRDLLAVDPDKGLTHLEGILVAYGQAQIAATTHSSVLKSMLEDRSLKVMSENFARVILEPGLLAAGGAIEDELRRRDQWIARCRKLCENLATLGLPMTLEHGDFHAGNMLLAGKACRIADWGDAAWSHPFFSLDVSLDNACQLLTTDRANPRLQRVSAAYLAVWRAAGHAGDLERGLVLAQQLRPAHGVLQWSRGLAHMPQEARVSAAQHMMQWLRAFA